MFCGEDEKDDVAAMWHASAEMMTAQDDVIISHRE